MTTANSNTRLVAVLEDDPTGTQSVEDVPVLLMPTADDVAALDRVERAVYVVTNSRAETPTRAHQVVREATASILASRPDAHVVMRGDSTLRGHLLEEYEAVRSLVYPDRHVPLLLVPALPAAHRVTVGGTHFIDGPEGRSPLHLTEYARDAGFSYSSSVLAEWAAERSDGLFDPSRAGQVSLNQLRLDGPAAVRRTIEALADAGGAAVCVPDAVTGDDIAVIATAVEDLWCDEVPFLIRCAPALAGELAGASATGYAELPRRSGPVLVVVGSYVTNTSRQLEALLRDVNGAHVPVDVAALAGEGAEAECTRVSREAGERMRQDGLVILATQRTRLEEASTLDAGMRAALNLARIVGMIDVEPSVVIAKGGITSALVARIGLAATRGRVTGPLVDGVPLWQLQTRWGPLPYVVVPGNVGGPDLLSTLVARARQAAACA